MTSILLETESECSVVHGRAASDFWNEPFDHGSSPRKELHYSTITRTVYDYLSGSGNRCVPVSKGLPLDVPKMSASSACHHEMEQLGFRVRPQDGRLFFPVPPFANVVRVTVHRFVRFFVCGTAQIEDGAKLSW